MAPTRPTRLTRPPLPSRRLWLSIGLAGSVIAASIVTYIGLIVVPRFEPVYQSFNASMPVGPALLNHWFGLAWLLPPGILILGWCWARPNGPVVAGVLGLVSPLIAFPIALALLYFPILQLAAV